MLGWLFPRSPIEPVEKAWAETHMLMLAGHFGLPRLLAADVVPAGHVVTTEYGGTVEDAREILSRLCAPLQLDSDTIRLELQADESRSNSCQSGQCKTGEQETGEQETGQQAAGEQAAGLSDTSAFAQPQQHAIRIAEPLLANPFSVAAVVARELAFLQLPMDQSSGPLQGQLGWLAELAAVYVGWGNVVAHARVDDNLKSHGCGSGGGTPTSLMPPRMMGYALALFAHVRGESQPTWRDTLRLDTQVVCNRSLRYLHRTHDTLFTSERAGQTVDRRPTPELLEQLEGKSPSARVAALWELRDASHAAAVAEVARCLHDRSPAIREEAAKTVGAYGAAAKSALPGLFDLLEDGRYSTRAAAARTLGDVGGGSREVLEHLAPLLRDSHRNVVFETATAVEKYGQQGDEAIPFVLGALRGAVIRCDHELIDVLTRTLYALDPDPTNRVIDFFEDDAELREQVVHILVGALGNTAED